MGRFDHRQHPGDAQSRRLLAVRLRHRQGFSRDAEGPPASRRSAGDIARPDAVPRRPHAWSSVLVDDREAADRQHRPPGEVVEAWPALHRRCRPHMSPLGGVGVDIAVQDAVAAANILAGPLMEGRLSDAGLPQAVRASSPMAGACHTSDAAVPAQSRMIAPTLAGTRPLRPPWPVHPVERRALAAPHPCSPAGMGVQPEHVRTKA